MVLWSVFPLLSQIVQGLPFSSVWNFTSTGFKIDSIHDQFCVSLFFFFFWAKLILTCQFLIRKSPTDCQYFHDPWAISSKIGKRQHPNPPHTHTRSTPTTHPPTHAPPHHPPPTSPLWVKIIVRTQSSAFFTFPWRSSSKYTGKELSFTIWSKRTKSLTQLALEHRNSPIYQVVDWRFCSL